MNNTVRRELVLPHSPEQVWQALTTPETLAEWLHPNDFEPRVGHRFTFVIAPKPEVKFDGLTVECEVLKLDAPNHLVISWSAGGPVVDTRVSFLLESVENGKGTRLLFEHSGFDLNHPFGKHAFKGADYGWGGMLEKLGEVMAR
jgi:uncharacterized protein YndB with AHSA1/START domain